MTTDNFHGIDRLVIAEVITHYTMLDEVLSDYLCRYYFEELDSSKFHFGVYWKKKKFRLFVHFMLDEMYLLKKMQMVHAIRSLPKNVRGTIERVNAIRNSMAHSFFPENRKEHMNAGKVLYGGIDIRTAAGLQRFSDDSHEAYTYLRKRVNRVWKS
jgi:hypothetical protein